MEPWDGPAAVAFTDGRVVGATLDRNGLRPGRWVETKDGYVVLGSETGVLGVAPGERQAPRAACSRARSSSSTSSEGRIVEDEEIKRAIATQQPYGEWFERARVHFDDLPSPRRASRAPSRCAARQLAFGYTQEDLRVLLAPMARDGRGADRLDGQRRRARRPVRPARRRCSATSSSSSRRSPTRRSTRCARRSSCRWATGVGAEGNLLDETPEHAHQLVMRPADPAQRRAREAAPGRPPTSSRAHDRHHVAGRARARGPGAQRWPTSATRRPTRIADGLNILILSDRGAGPDRAPIPSLLAVGARAPPPRARGHAPARGPRRSSPASRARSTTSRRSSATAPARSTPTSCSTRSTSWPPTGASPASSDADEAERQRRQGASARACSRRSPRWASRRSSPTAARRSSRRSGWSPTLIDRHFTGTASRIGGIGLDVLAREALDRHARA